MFFYRDVQGEHAGQTTRRLKLAPTKTSQARARPRRMACSWILAPRSTTLVSGGTATTFFRSAYLARKRWPPGLRAGKLRGSVYIEPDVPGSKGFDHGGGTILQILVGRITRGGLAGALHGFVEIALGCQRGGTS